MSVSPEVLKKAEKGDRSLRGIGFRNITRLFGEETVALLQRTGRFEPAHRDELPNAIRRFKRQQNHLIPAFFKQAGL